MRFSDDISAKAYLAGIIDGEGCMSQSNLRIRIRVCDMEIIDACVEIANKFDLHYRLYLNNKPKNQNHSDYHEIDIGGVRSLKWILENIPIQLSYKKNLLERFVNSFINIYPESLTKAEESLLKELLWKK